MIIEFFINDCIRSLLVVNAEESKSQDEVKHHLGDKFDHVEDPNSNGVIFPKCRLGQIPIIVRNDLPKDDPSKAEIRALLRWGEQVANDIFDKLAPEAVKALPEKGSYVEQISDEILSAVDDLTQKQKMEIVSHKRSLGIQLADFNKAFENEQEGSTLKKALKNVIDDAYTKKNKEEITEIVNKAMENEEIKKAIDAIRERKKHPEEKSIPA